MTGRDLAKLFNHFNQTYFRGRLPRYGDVVDRMTNLGEAGHCNPKSKVIRIQRGLGESQSISTLLHEMAHAVTPDGHGMPWKREMIRLRSFGAPLTGPDSEIGLNDWNGMRVTKAHFETVLGDILIDFPQVTLSQAMRGFIRREGGPATVAEFKRKYPWVAAVFRRTKGEHDQHVSRRAAILAAIKPKTNEG